ncbi:MAG: histidinol-phosphatase [Candidatus Methylacidiphilales bacterium]|nr:histidinol-phosphatase [Candidatus Methylacidiphilales bacterium]
MKPEAALDFLETLALAAGEVILPYFQQPGLVVDAKSDATPVTQADRRAEEVMRDLIAKHHPSHGIIGEEFGNEAEDAEFVWVLDPIDGTKSFVAGIPLFGVLIGLLHGGKPVAGCIHQPVLREMCLGNAEQTTLNGRSVRVRECSGLDQALVLSTCPGSPEQFPNASGFDRIRSKARLVRTWGDCYGYLMVASGRADLMMDPVLNPWDLLPLIPIIHGAGGILTAWSGGDALAEGSALAGSRAVHAAALKCLEAGQAG